ncbi:MAG: DUF86 domain-containing protein [Anaerolineales bacterium]|nr:DUF86 domain-containing protein [Anaerolineales bacterium]
MSSIPASDAIRLRHMLDAAQKALAFVDGRDRSDLESDEMLALALVRLIEILGEAATRVSPEVQAELPGIPWRQIAGTRNRLIHGYFDVDLDIVWAIVQDDLPPCVAILDNAISQRDA